jgi:uncharacterized spore protein YtfJ
VATRVQDGSELAEALLKRIGDTVGERANVSTVFGEPVEREGVTVIPVARARFGFGGGGGGGALVSPVGYIEVHDGTAQFKRISGPIDLVGFVAAASLAALSLKRLLAG